MKKLLIATFFLMNALNTMAGNLTNRFELTLERVERGGPPFYTPEFILADAQPRHERRFTEFSGDVSGRYIEALSSVAMLTGRRFPQLDAVVSATLKLQKEDGHFGDPFTTSGVTNHDMALLWGNGRMLIGLLTYHQLKPDPEVLACAARLGDCFVSLAPRLNNDAVQKEFSDSRIAVGYICWTQIIEGLAELARATKDARYSDLAREIAARTTLYPAQHSHGFVTTLRGILDLHELTSDTALLAQVERQWQAILDSGNLFAHGALPEAFKPKQERDEGCSEADWLRLNLALWSKTKNPRYLEQAQRCLFNEFFFNQFKSGDFGHREMNETGAKPPASRAWWCCTFHGLRAFTDVFQDAFSVEKDALVYDLPVDARAKAGAFALRAESRLERDGTVDFVVTDSDANEHTLAVRVPAWASWVDLQLAGAPLEATTTGGLCSVKRVFSPGERVTARYALRTRAENGPEGKLFFWRGPWLLAADNDLSPHFFDEPWSLNRAMLPEGAIEALDKVTLPRAPQSSSDSPFAVPVAHASLPFLQGGYPMQPQTALLRPIAEQTASDDRTSWQWGFATSDKKQ